MLLGMLAAGPMLTSRTATQLALAAAPAHLLSNRGAALVLKPKLSSRTWQPLLAVMTSVAVSSVEAGSLVDAAMSTAFCSMELPVRFAVRTPA